MPLSETPKVDVANLFGLRGKIALVTGGSRGKRRARDEVLTTSRYRRVNRNRPSAGWSANHSGTARCQ